MKLLCNKLTYCGFSARILGTNKVVYCAKYGPKSGTISPRMDTESSTSSLISDSHVSREQFIEFVTSDITKQADGKHKGGRWGTNNFTVTSDEWFPGLYVNDTIELTYTRVGLIPNKFNADKVPLAFNDSDQIITNSEGLAWSCNATWAGNEYHFYMTDNVMPQMATDTFFINYIRPQQQTALQRYFKAKPNKAKIYTKVIRRGNDTKNVDSPDREMPCVGEHLEPGQSDEARDQVMFTINQELGIHKQTLSKCYLLELGVYNKKGRDGRYSTYCINTGCGWERCGIERPSSSQVRILLIISEILDRDDEDVLPEDTTEINSKRWVDVDKVLSEYNEDNWMLNEHLVMLRDAVEKINTFADEQKILSDGTDTKEGFKF